MNEMAYSKREGVPSIFHNLQAGKAQRVVLYGTSLTAGGAWAGATGEWFEQNYPGRVTFINSGGPGENSDWGVENLSEKVLSLHPDLVFIEFSYNDAHDRFDMAVEKGASNLDKIVRAIKTQNSETTIVLQIMNANWDAPNGNRSSSGRPKLRQFNDNYRCYAIEHGLTLLDHYPAWEKLKENDPDTFHRYIPDGTHPSEEGSLAVTWPAVRDWLEQSRRAAQATPI